MAHQRAMAPAVSRKEGETGVQLNQRSAYITREASREKKNVEIIDLQDQKVKTVAGNS